MLGFLFRQFATYRSQKGLYHGADLRTGFSHTFSGKRTKRTFKPNNHKKVFWSHILNRHLKIDVTMCALKNIRLKGGLDNYLLYTDNKLIRSQFGELLKGYIQKKKADPDWPVPYIPGTRKAWKSKRIADLRQQSAIWRPPEIRYNDFTEFEFDRYDPNAPPRPEMIKAIDPRQKLMDDEIIKASYSVKNTEFAEGSSLKEITDGIHKQLEMSELSLRNQKKPMAKPGKKLTRDAEKKAKKQAASRRPPKTFEKKFMKRFREKVTKQEIK